MSTPKPVVLTILDGWGLNEDTSSNAPVLANTPTMDRLFATCPNARLTTFGPNVGLPTGQMGNSEVGHTNIGAGRIVAMDLGQIDLAIEDGSFFRNAAMLDFAATVKAAGGVAHLMCVVSDGGVHGHILHGQAAVKLMISHGLKVVVHAITDGRDVAPQSAEDFVAALVASLPQGASIGTVIGRYYAMDRDNRWERVEKAYDAMVLAKGEHARDAFGSVGERESGDVTVGGAQLVRVLGAKLVHPELEVAIRSHNLESFDLRGAPDHGRAQIENEGSRGRCSRREVRELGVEAGARQGAGIGSAGHQGRKGSSTQRMLNRRRRKCGPSGSVPSARSDR